MMKKKKWHPKIKYKVDVSTLIPVINFELMEKPKLKSEIITISKNESKKERGKSVNKGLF